MTEDLSERLEGLHVTISEFQQAYMALKGILREQFGDPRVQKLLGGISGYFVVKKHDPRIIDIGESQLVLALGTDNHLCAKFERRTVSKWSDKREFLEELATDYHLLGEGHENDVMMTLECLRLIRDAQGLDYLVPFCVQTVISTWYQNQSPVDITVDLTLGGECVVREIEDDTFDLYQNGDSLRKSYETAVDALQRTNELHPELYLRPCRHTHGRNKKPFERTFLLVDKKADRKGYLVAADLNNLSFQYTKAGPKW